MLSEKKALDILSTIKDEQGEKKISEFVKIKSIVNDHNVIKLRIKVSEYLRIPKQILRKKIEDTFMQAGFDVLVSISLEESESRSKSAMPQIREIIPSEVFKKFKKIIAVYSTKGGVGKSTIAVQLALALAEKSVKIALIDLDIYGPSVPRILGSPKKITVKNGQFIPVKKNNIDMMSVGLLIPNIESPLIWRAPIVNGVVQQIFTDTLWDDMYDFLIIDLPPGTGDIPILAGQSIPIDGILAVSTPHAVALEDTIKGLSMFRKFNIPILGFVYNMGFISCKYCHQETDLCVQNTEFSHIFDNFHTNVLGNLPLDPEISIAADRGALDLIDQTSLWKKEFDKITTFFNNM